MTEEEFYQAQSEKEEYEQRLAQKEYEDFLQEIGEAKEFLEKHGFVVTEKRADLSPAITREELERVRTILYSFDAHGIRGIKEISFLSEALAILNKSLEKT